MRAKILAFLSEIKGPPVTPKGVAAAIHEPKQKVATELRKMASEEQVSVSGVVGAGFRYFLIPSQRLSATK